MNNWLKKYQNAGKVPPPKPWQNVGTVAESTAPKLNTVRLTDQQVNKNVVTAAKKQKAVQQYAKANNLPVEVAEKAMQYSEAAAAANAAHPDAVYATPGTTFADVQHNLSHPLEYFTGRPNTFDALAGIPGYVIGTAVPNTIDAAVHPIRTGSDLLHGADYVLGHNTTEGERAAMRSAGLIMDAAAGIPAIAGGSSALRAAYAAIPTEEQAARLTKSLLLDNAMKKGTIDYNPVIDYTIDPATYAEPQLRELSALERAHIDNANELGQRLADLQHHVGKNASVTDPKERALFEKAYIDKTEKLLNVGKKFTDPEIFTVSRNSIQRPMVFHKANTYRIKHGMEPWKMEDFIEKPYSSEYLPFGEGTYNMFATASPEEIELYKNNPDVYSAYEKWKTTTAEPSKNPNEFTKKTYEVPDYGEKPSIFDNYVNRVNRQHFENIQDAMEKNYFEKMEEAKKLAQNYYLPTKSVNDFADAPELLHILTAESSSNPGAQVLKAYKQFAALPSGEVVTPAHSLSSNSKPLSLGVAKLAQRQGTLGDIGYHGMGNYNPMGFPTRLGIPNEILSLDVNKIIQELNSTLPVGKKIPFTKVDPTRRNLKYPYLTYTRKKYGGWLNNYK